MAAPITGQLPITTSAQQLTLTVAATAFEIKAPLANTNTVYIGPAGVTTSTGHALEPGDRFAYERSDQHGQARYPLSPADFYAIGIASAQDVLTWLVSP